MSLDHATLVEPLAVVLHSLELASIRPGETAAVFGVDVAIDCGGKDGSINHCANTTRNAGRVVVTAIQPGVDTPVNLHTMRRKEMTVYNVRRSNHESAAALSMLAEHTARFGPIVTHTRPLDEISRVFAQLESYEDGVAKVVIRCSG
jgi:L-iditol 2-dehydrogenase